MQSKVLDLNGVVAKVEWRLRLLLGGDVNLLTITTRDIGLVRANAGQLEQVIIDLAMKAKETMRTGGTLTLATSNVVLDQTFARAHPGVATGPHVMLTLTDTATVLAGEIKAHLFRHSGAFVVAEREPGRGNTFRIYLPCVDEAGLDLQDAAPDDRSNVR